MKDENINLLVNELTNEIDETNEFNLSKLDKWNQELNINNLYPELIYSEYTVKDLIKICKYYNIECHKKYKKQDLITNIIYFESLIENTEIVEKRRQMWNFINELLEDPKMKQYIIWN